MTANDGQRRPTECFFTLFFNVLNFYFIFVTQQPTTANEGQRRSTKAHSSQRWPTKTNAGSAWKSGPVRFFGLFGQDRDRDPIKTCTSQKTGPRPQKTAKSVFCGLFAVFRPV